MFYEFDWSSIAPSWPFLLDGLVVTAKITITAIVVGDIVGNGSRRDASIYF